MTEGDILFLERELRRFPEGVVVEGMQAGKIIASSLSREEFLEWAREGIALSEHSFRSWEAAKDYFRTSPQMVSLLPFPSLLRWASLGRWLAETSPLLASAYFRSSPQALAYIHPSQLKEWAELGRSLYKGTWKSGSLAARFFEISPRLFSLLNMLETAQLVTFVDFLAQKSTELAIQCLTQADDMLSQVSTDWRGRFLDLAIVMARASWSDAKACWEGGARILGRIKPEERENLFSLVERIARWDGRRLLPFLLDSSRSFTTLEPSYHPLLISYFERLLSLSPLAGMEFIRSFPEIVQRLKEEGLEAWVKAGINILKENEEGGLAFFRLESEKGEEVLEALSSALELEKVREVMKLYSQALTGRDLHILQASELMAKQIGWTSPYYASTDGRAIFLPPQVDRYPKKQQNFSWYKVLSTHQVAHLEFGSFDFVFNREASLFPNLRKKLAAARGEAKAVTDLELFFDLFPNRRLASDIFTIVEDTRADCTLRREYLGIRKAYEIAQNEALEQRPAIPSQGVREAVLELLVRLSLGDKKRQSIPASLRTLIEKMSRLLLKVQAPQAIVEDSAEATIRLYQFLNSISSDAGEESQEDFTPPESQDGEEAAFELDFSAFSPDQMEDASYSSPKEVEFRGDFKPELVQLLQKLREMPKDEDTQSQKISQELLKEFLEKSAEIKLQEAQGEPSTSTEVLMNNLLKEMGVPPSTQEAGTSHRKSTQGQGGPLERDEPLSFLYNEWDFRAGDYKPRWCRVRERKLEEGSPEFFEKTLEENYFLVAQIKRQFELLTPDIFRKIKRLHDGEDLELDALIEAVVEKKSGTSPTDKIYWKRNKVQRDVAVVFLLDMSASTAEAIEDSRSPAAPPLWPRDDPQQYASWLRSRRDEVGRRPYKRIIDVEKESIVLLIQALETIGDTYGIYGFSGYGRENVEFFIIKDLDEDSLERAKRRIDKIAPWHATRMGPAIRHATSKLEARDARTKILFLVSDGRPQDHGYSRDGVEKEYAIHDTHMALIEAKRKAITPFCLTIDRGGHDYLKVMCNDLGYQVLPDVRSLPKRLPLLYRSLTL